MSTLASHFAGPGSAWLLPAAGVSPLKRRPARSTTSNETGMKKMAMSEAMSMPPITAVPSTRRETAPAPAGKPQGHAAQNKSECGHQDRAQSKLSAGQGSIK